MSAERPPFDLANARRLAWLWDSGDTSELTECSKAFTSACDEVQRLLKELEHIPLLRQQNAELASDIARIEAEKAAESHLCRLTQEMHRQAEADLFNEKLRTNKLETAVKRIQAISMGALGQQ